MPWLIKGNTCQSQNLFFVHIPRCGGTSLSQHFDVAAKALNGRNWFATLGLKIFFRRYKILESANFPIFTAENAFCSILALLCILTRNHLKTVGHGDGWEMFLCRLGLLLSGVVSFCMTILFTAPVVGRVTWVRRTFMFLVHYVLFRFMESIEWCTGVNKTGYMMHLTVYKLLAYGYIESEVMNNVSSMAIVRNPYSRMVSIYLYNRFTSFESFPHFVRSWYTNTASYYRTHRECDEYYTPCHAIPQFEFTHVNGVQIVQSVVKQEELKYLKTSEGAARCAAEMDSTVADLPDPVRRALLGMPHANKRSDTGTNSKKWWEYYDQETLDMTYDLYRKDFEVFGYSDTLLQRPDLKPPARINGAKKTRKVVDVTDYGSLDSDSVESEGVDMQHMKRDSLKVTEDEFERRGSTIKQSSVSFLNASVLAELEAELARDNGGAYEVISPNRRQSTSISSDNTSDSSQ